MMYITMIYVIAVFLTHVAVSVALERSSYTVDEGVATIEVCAILHGSTDVNISVTLIVDEDTQLTNSFRARGKSRYKIKKLKNCVYTICNVSNLYYKVDWISLH